MVIDNGVTELNPKMILRSFVAKLIRRMIREDEPYMRLRVAITNEQYHVFEVYYSGVEPFGQRQLHADSKD